jgi:hypothetical protein
MMCGPRACGRLLVVLSLLLPSLGFAEAEIWLVLGAIEPSDAPVDPTYARDRFLPEAGAIAMREGDVTVMPTCEAGINLGFRSASGASPREKTVVRLQKKRIASGCALEVLHIGIEGRRSVATDGSLPPAPRSSDVPSIADPRHLDDRAVPCGAELIEVRQSPLGGSSLHVKGIGESGECHEATESLGSSLSIRWLDPPSDGEPDAVTAPATAPR